MLTYRGIEVSGYRGAELAWPRYFDPPKPRNLIQQLHDAPRRALAAHLLEQGDSLGELIFAQLSEKRDWDREAKLTENLSRTWQLPAGAFRDVCFRRGFPTEAVLAADPLQAFELRSDWRLRNVGKSSAYKPAKTSSCPGG